MPNGNQQSRRGRGRGRAAINRANNAESLANTQSLPRDTRASTPEDPDMLAKQQEFRDWCARMQFPDGDMVTEAKLVLFLTELVETRGLELESRSPSLSPDLPQRETTTNSSREQEARDIDPDNPPLLYQLVMMLGGHLDSMEARQERIEEKQLHMMEDMAKMTDVMKEMMEAMMLGFEAQKARSGGTYTYTLRANPPPQPQPQPQWAMRQTLIATAIPRHDASASARANVEPASRADPGPPPSTTTTTTNKPPEVAPKHRMCRGLKNVESLWREWTVGFDGVPSIQALDRKWGTKWRSGRQAEQQWYSLRREVIREIKRIASTEGISEDAAVQQVQLQQQQMRCSLDHLCKRLRVERKARVESNPGVAVQ